MKYFILTLIMAMGLAVLAADVVFSYTLNEPELKTANGYSHLKLDGAQSWGTPGSPDLPWYGTKILLPIGEEAVDIQVEFSSPQTLTLTLPVAPLQPQYPAFQHCGSPKASAGPSHLRKHYPLSGYASQWP